MVTTVRESPAGAADVQALRVLVVDDEPSITQLLAMALRYDGWNVHTAATGEDAVAAVRSFLPDVMVLDIMLPDFDGMQVLSRLRHNGAHVPVLFLTALDSVDDRVRGLTAGGDDYMVKPFSIEELVARLRALVRRSQMQRGRLPNPILRVGDLVLNEDSYEVERAGEPIELTSTEYELLRFLMRNERRVLSKAQILDRVWNYDYGGKPTVVELYISYLRKKIDAGRAPMIHTVRGAGYVLKPAE
ncbi:MAG: response regulator transcription factor [Leucobacter sp.]|jgi:two-component system OmpR family response regulator|nr:response regulator transcription factor [Leucobacter sp.]